MTSTIMNKNRRVSLMKQETIGIIWLICDWGISTVHPLCTQNIAWQYNVTYLI